MSRDNPLAQPATWDLVAPGYASGSIDHFENYATNALELAQVAGDEEVLDVATGPGSLALLAARTAAHVAALDFSPGMLAQCEARAAALGVTNLTTHAGDGQALPFEAERFDAAFSMFGLMFFPDRAAGFRELHRVLRPGGRCVVASWHPMDEIEVFNTVMGVLGEVVGDAATERPAMPLSDAAECRTEMSAAGFSVDVTSVTHSLEADSLDDFFAGFRKAFAPVVLLENRLGDGFEPVAQTILEALHRNHTDGPIAVPMSAHLALGRKLRSAPA